MARRKPKRLPPIPGWAVYLRTSTKDLQNPKMSHDRQRFSIQQSLLARSELPLISEYSDIESGTRADRREYQNMLKDARMGDFSHVAVENAERFGRNDAEALSVIDELDSLGIAVRFADYPDLNPMGADDRIMVSLSFTLARRESMKLGERVRGGINAKLRNGGWAGKAPDGYVNKEEKTEGSVQTQHGKYTRWVEQDPKQIQVWRYAWELLLENSWTLEEICEKLHARGYYYHTGRPFVKVNKDGTRSSARNGLSRNFHNWFYAGWVVSEKAKISPKTIRGQWKPLISTEEFERGLEILKRRVEHKTPRRRHFYLLSGLVYYVCPTSGKQKRMTCSTPNASRSSGGNPYYCVESQNVHLSCHKIDQQIPEQLMMVQVDPELIPAIQECYTQDLADKLVV
jgi:DNA invertase Pin-like site-specific DNA recombinase